MKRLLYILTFLPLFAYGQNSGSVLKTGATNQATVQKGGNGADSGLILPVIDTVRGKAYLSTGGATLRQKGRIIVDANDSTKLYYYNGNKWQTAGTSVDTSLFLRKTDTSRSGIVTTYFYVDSVNATDQVAKNWRLVYTPDSNRWVGCAYGAGVWVIVGFDNIGAAQCYITRDGSKFEEVTIPSGQPYDIEYNGVTFNICYLTGVTRIATSYDARTWFTTLNSTTFSTGGLMSLAPGMGRIVALPTGGTSYAISYDNGWNWTIKTGIPANYYRDSRYFEDSVFVAVGLNIIVRSTDGGETFTSVTPLPELGSFFGVTYDSGIAISTCADCDTYNVLYSTDMGETWVGDSSINNIGWRYAYAAEGWFVLSGYVNLTADSFAYFARSKSGLSNTWELITIDNIGLPYDNRYGKVGGFHHLKFANGMWLAPSVRGYIATSGRLWENEDNTPKTDSNVMASVAYVDNEIASVSVDTTSLSDRINVNKDSITYLGINYFKKGGNSFGAPAILGTNDANYLAFEVNNTEAGRIFSATGNWRIGGTTDNGDKLSVNGTIHATGGGGVGYRVTNGTAIRTDGTMYIDALNATDGQIFLRYGASLSNTATFNNNGAIISPATITGFRFQGNYTDNSSTTGIGISYFQYSNTGEDYAELRSSKYTTGTFNNYAWTVLNRNGKGVIIGTSYDNGTGNVLQVTGNANVTGTLNIGTVTAYADNAAAVTAGLAVGTLYYRTGHGLDIVR